MPTVQGATLADLCREVSVEPTLRDVPLDIKCRLFRNCLIGYWAHSSSFLQFHPSIDTRCSALALKEMSALPNRSHLGFGDQVTRANDRRTCLSWELAHYQPTTGDQWVFWWIYDSLILITISMRLFKNRIAGL